MAYYACPLGHGDFNGDGLVDAQDFKIFQKCYLKVVADYPECLACDLDVSGLVQVRDFSLFAIIWNGYCPICKIPLTKYIPNIPKDKTKIWPWVMAAAVAGTVVFAVSKEK